MTAYPHRHGLHLHRPHVNLWLVAVVGLAAGLIALGLWVLIDRYTGGSSTTHDATTLIDHLYADISAGNVNAATALFTSHAIIWEGDGTQVTGTDDIRALMIEAKSVHATATRVAPVAVYGNFAATYEQDNVLSGPAVSVYQLRDGKIFRWWSWELGTNKPFDTTQP